MSDPVEELLARQRLHRPPEALDARVRRVFRQAEPPRAGRRRWAAWAAVAAAVAAGALVAMHFWTPRGRSRPEARKADPAAAQPAPTPLVSAEPAAQPVQLRLRQSVVLDEGLFFLEDDTPIRRFRRCQTERLVWYDPVRGVRIEATLPREEVVLVRADSY